MSETIARMRFTARLIVIPNPKKVWPWVTEGHTFDFPESLYSSRCSTQDLMDFRNKFIVRQRYIRWDLLVTDIMDFARGRKLNIHLAIDDWIDALGQSLSWLASDTDGLNTNKLNRKRHSHLGGHARYYIISELWRRSGRTWTNPEREDIVEEDEYTVVPNGAYLKIYEDIHHLIK